MQSTPSLIEDIERFLERNNLSATRFGVLAAGDTKFVKTLREGRTPRASTVERVREWMQQQAEA
jgi:hypothetical protein